MIDLFKYNSTDAPALRVAMRSMVNTVNYSAIMQAVNKLKKSKDAIPDDGFTLNHIDNYDEANLDAADIQEAMRNLEEQGFTVREDPTVNVALMRIVAKHFYNDLLEHADKEVDRMTGFQRPVSWQVAQTIRETLFWMCTRKLQVNEAQVQARAQLYNVHPDQIRGTIETDAMKEQKWMRENASDIMAVIHASTWAGDNIDAQEAANRLPPINYMRLLVSADTALLRKRVQNVEICCLKSTHPLLRAALEGDLILIDGLRKAIHLHSDSKHKEKNFLKAYHAAILNGATAPQLKQLDTTAKEEAVVIRKVA